MAIFLTKVVVGVPKFSDKPGAHWRRSPDGTQAIVEFIGNRTEYRTAKTNRDTTELTRRQARAMARQWNRQLRGRA